MSKAPGTSPLGVSPAGVAIGMSVASPTSTEASFTDAPAGAQFRNKSMWLAVEGISTGWPDGTFSPVTSMNLNRDTMPTFMYRFTVDGTTDRLTSVDILGPCAGLNALSANWHMCALTEHGSIKCWGDDSLGKLGDGDANRSRPDHVVEFHSPEITHHDFRPQTGASLRSNIDTAERLRQAS